MKIVSKNGVPVHYSFTSLDGGVDKCFEQMANDTSLCLVESYKDNVCQVAHTLGAGSEIVVQGGILRLNAPFNLYGTLKVLSGATLYLASSLTIGYKTPEEKTANPTADCTFEVYDGATLVIDNCALKALFGANLKIHKYATLIFVNSTAGLNIVPEATTTFAGQVQTPGSTTPVRDWTTAQDNVDPEYIDPIRLVELINGNQNVKATPYTFVSEAQEMADALAIVDEINIGHIE